MAENERSSQYLTFDLAEETYGIEVTTIREILEVQTITRVPRTADYLLGVMNVRGRVVPVVDLRQKFELEKVDQTVDSAIIVLEVQQGSSDTLIGLLVDSVDEVLEFAPGEIEPAPTVGTSVNGQLLTGMGKRDDQFILLLDTDVIFDSEELEMARKQGESESRQPEGAGVQLGS
jgi:purine-binding chemotaxis protein CheW